MELPEEYRLEPEEGEKTNKLTFSELDSFIKNLALSLKERAEHDIYRNNVTPKTHKYLILSKLLYSVIYSDYDTRYMLYSAINFHGAYNREEPVEKPDAETMKEYEDYVKYLYKIDLERYSNELDLRQQQ